MEEAGRRAGGGTASNCCGASTRGGVLEAIRPPRPGRATLGERETRLAPSVLQVQRPKSVGYRCDTELPFLNLPQKGSALAGEPAAAAPARLRLDQLQLAELRDRGLEAGR